MAPRITKQIARNWTWLMCLLLPRRSTTCSRWHNLRRCPPVDYRIHSGTLTFARPITEHPAWDAHRKLRTIKKDGSLRTAHYLSKHLSTEQFWIAHGSELFHIPLSGPTSWLVRYLMEELLQYHRKSMAIIHSQASEQPCARSVEDALRSMRALWSRKRKVRPPLRPPLCYHAAELAESPLNFSFCGILLVGAWIKVSRISPQWVSQSVSQHQPGAEGTIKA